jgi:hypothetical protein
MLMPSILAGNVVRSQRFFTDITNFTALVESPGQHGGCGILVEAGLSYLAAIEPWI